MAQGALLVGTVAVTSLALGAAVHAVSSPVLTSFLGLAASANLWVLGLRENPKQIMLMRRQGTQGVSKLLQAAFALNYLSWGTYCLMTKNYIEASGFIVAGLSEAAVVAQFSRVINSKAE